MTTPDIVLQAVGPEGAPVLVAIHAEAFQGGEVWDVDALSALLRLPGTHAFVALINREPAGFILLRSIAGEAEVLTLAVRPAFRGRKCGQKLVSESKKFSPVFLEVSVRNNSALSLYKRCGFAEIGRRRAYYRDGSDALVLVFTS